MRRNNKYLLVILIFLILVAILFFTLEKKEIKEVCYKEKCFEVKIADTGAEIQNGLMNIQELPENEGMLFVFGQEDKYPFWMKDTLIPLDIIWLNGKKEIVSIKEEASPCKTPICERFIPVNKARYVLEINSGLCNKSGIEIGSKLQFK